MCGCDDYSGGGGSGGVVVVVKFQSRNRLENSEILRWWWCKWQLKWW